MMYPDFQTFKKLAERHGLVPTFEVLPADLLTPVTAYLKLAEDNPYGAVLESAEGGERFGRYSYIAVSHHLQFEYAKGEVRLEFKSRSPLFKSFAPRIKTDDPMGELRRLFKTLNPAFLKELPRFCGGAVGMLGYDIVRQFEKLPDILPDDLGIPDALLFFTDTCAVFDHWKHKIYLIKWNLIDDKSDGQLKKIYGASERALAELIRKTRSKDMSHLLHAKRTSRAVDPKSNCTQQEYMDGVKKIKEYIRAGDIIQAVYSQRFEIAADVDPVQLYRALRVINPSPYLFLMKMGSFTLAGSSPEILVRKEGSTAISRPIAGTRPRGADEAADMALEKELKADPKERAEHLMLVDLGRNDLGRCCRTGSIRVKDFMSIERYSHVMHLCSNVEGTLANGEDAFSLLQCCFPAGTVSGAPKIRAMEIIEECEKTRRGNYAGSVGFFTYKGDMDMAITIRTILVKKGKIFMQAGAGIVADSVPETEEKETRSKAAALFKAVELAGKGNF
jgi:anthranilate synthase component 1